MIATNQQMDEVHGVHEAFAPKATESRLELGDNRRISELQGHQLVHELQGEGFRAELPAVDIAHDRRNET